MNKPLCIFSYVSKQNGTPYKMCYLNGKFYFVHITKEKIKECIKKKSFEGKEYLQYNGKYEVDENTIKIY